MKIFWDEELHGISDQEVVDAIMSVPLHQSANLVVDLGNTCYMQPTIGIGGAGSGLIYAASGAVVGAIADMINADTYCNLVAVGNAVFTSGQLRFQVQTADAATSGSFTDPMSGMAAADLPTAFSSGGILWINSGGTGGSSGGLFGGFVSGQAIQSGFALAAAFQRVGRYARAIVMSGDFYAGTLTASFISQLKTTGSGGGFAFSPGSGTVSV